VDNLLPDLQKICLDHWDNTIFRKHTIEVDVLRLDKIHSQISGNKWFKLKYYLKRARETNKKKLISFGGPYSNHLLALAAAAKINDFSSIGFIRGEAPLRLPHTLVEAKGYGMELRFLSRAEYNSNKRTATLAFGDKNETDTADISDTDALLIPEGGAGTEGLRGAEEILTGFPTAGYSHICCAVGTGTTMAGLINCAESDQKIIGVSVLRGTRHFEPLNISWIKNKAFRQNVQMIHGDHFGGYAKYTKPLIDFMNRFFIESGIPTDFVYTGKLFYAIARMAQVNEFPAESRILVLHTGGLQGNMSLPLGLLQF
jgi:1-aminocyclopropane-1-carboxylate deaminase